MEILLVGLNLAIQAGLCAGIGWILGEIHGPFPKRRVRQEIPRSFRFPDKIELSPGNLLYEATAPVVVASPPLHSGDRVVEDDFGTLYRSASPVVEVTNKTPEPDGTSKTYRLRVPSTITTPKEAVAWTFGRQAREYSPEVET